MDTEGVTVYGDNMDLIDVIRRTIDCQKDQENYDEAFHLMDLGYQVRAVDQWQELLPGVTPFYAVKANPDSVLLRQFATLNFGFDCASKVEIETILNLGVPPTRIVYANTCKQPSHLRYASRVGIRVTTFDDSDELIKISEIAPNMCLLLRISTEGFTKCHPEGITEKFGCRKENSAAVLGLAKKLNLNLIGVSFHIGAFATSPVAFALAIREAKRVFREAEELGYDMTLLDIGGGLPPKTITDLSTMEFGEVANIIREAVHDNFGQNDAIRVIAEPGSYFTAPSTVLVTSIIGRRHRKKKTDPVPRTEYFINDGIYCSFRIFHELEIKKPVAKPVSRHYEGASLRKCTIWGQTCAPDMVREDGELPDMKTGDWLYFPDCGAYSASMASTTFNGFQRRPLYRFITETMRNRLNEIISEGGFGLSDLE